MQLQNELNKLTKKELINLIMNKGMFLRIEKRDITLIRIETLYMKAETDGKKPLIIWTNTITAIIWNGAKHYRTTAKP